MNDLNRWTIHLSKTPTVEIRAEEPAPVGEGTYMVSAVKMNGVPVRSTLVGMMMSPVVPVRLSLKIMPRSLEFIMEDEDGDQETNQG